MLKEDDLACGILKCFFGDVQPLVDQQEEVRTVRSTDLFYLPAQLLGMPETNKLDHDTSVLIFGIDQHEIWHHDGIPEQEHFALTRQMPVPSFASYLLLKLVGKICFETAVKLA